MFENMIDKGLTAFGGKFFYATKLSNTILVDKLNLLHYTVTCRELILFEEIYRRVCVKEKKYE